MNNNQPSIDHYKGVITRLSEKIAMMTVENASLHQRLDEYASELEALKGDSEEN